MALRPRPGGVLKYIRSPLPLLYDHRLDFAVIGVATDFGRCFLDCKEILPVNGATAFRS